MLPILESDYSPIIKTPPPLYEEHPQNGELDEVYSDVFSSPTASTSTLDDSRGISSDYVRQIFMTMPNCPAYTLDASSFVGPLRTNDLNPEAAPFVPKAPLQGTFPPRSRRLLRPETITQHPRMSKWRRSFNAVATRPSTEQEDVHSLIIVATEAWEADQLAELAQEFCWRLAEAAQDEVEAILVFMLKLSWRFRYMKSEKLADEFEWQLKEFIHATFLSVWDAKANCEAISYDNANPTVIHAAHMLGIAIGKLFSRGFFDTRDIHGCLRVLLSNFVSVEHAETVAALFHHMGPRYWYEHPDGHGHLQEFRHAFGYIMQRLEGQMSLLNKPWPHERLATLMDTVAEQTAEFDEQMVMTARAQTQLPLLQRPLYPGDPVHFGAHYDMAQALGFRALQPVNS